MRSGPTAGRAPVIADNVNYRGPALAPSVAEPSYQEEVRAA